jgi:hypothetical protein
MIFKIIADIKNDENHNKSSPSSKPACRQAGLRSINKYRSQ